MSKAKKYLNKKVTEDNPEMGYSGFLHYCDCRHEEKQAKEIPEWMESYHQSQMNETAQERYQKAMLLIIKTPSINGINRTIAETAVKTAAFGDNKN